MSSRSVSGPCLSLRFPVLFQSSVLLLAPVLTDGTIVYRTLDVPILKGLECGTIDIAGIGGEGGGNPQGGGFINISVENENIPVGHFLMVRGSFLLSSKIGGHDEKGDQHRDRFESGNVNTIHPDSDTVIEPKVRII